MRSQTVSALSIAAGLLVILALPPAMVKRSARRFLIGLPLVFVGVLLPLFIFAFSIFLVPEWKGGCKHGWLDCFFLGKLSLTPLVLWATAAWYAVEVWGAENRNRWWIGMGFCFGALVSSICLVYGLFTLGAEGQGFAPWLLVPLYVAIWHSTRVMQLMGAGSLGLLDCLKAVAGSVPFWTVGVIWSRYTYQGLPDSPPCFVATAAMRGHSRLVGPFFEVKRHGVVQLANKQLLTLWRFEALWSVHMPLLHSRFRAIYNRLGRRIARAIRAPWAADVVYLVLIPIEAVANLIINVHAVLTQRATGGTGIGTFK